MVLPFFEGRKHHAGLQVYYPLLQFLRRADGIHLPAPHEHQGIVAHFFEVHHRKAGARLNVLQRKSVAELVCDQDGIPLLVLPEKGITHGNHIQHQSQRKCKYMHHLKSPINDLT